MGNIVKNTRGGTTYWTVTDPTRILKRAEIAFEYNDTFTLFLKMKVGDGVTQFQNLPNLIETFLQFNIAAFGNHIATEAQNGLYIPINSASDVTIEIPDSLTQGWLAIYYRESGVATVTVKLESGTSKTIIGDVSGTSTLDAGLGQEVLIKVFPSSFVSFKGDVS